MKHTSHRVPSLLVERGLAMPKWRSMAPPAGPAQRLAQPLESDLRLPLPAIWWGGDAETGSTKHTRSLT